MFKTIEPEDLRYEVFEASPFLLGKLGWGRSAALAEVCMDLRYMGASTQANPQCMRVVVWLLRLWFHRSLRLGLWLGEILSEDRQMYFL